MAHLISPSIIMTLNLISNEFNCSCSIFNLVVLIITTKKVHASLSESKKVINRDIM